MQSIIQNGHLLKARLTLTPNGTRINWKNVSYAVISEITLPEGQMYSIGVKWKYKASILTEEILLPIETNLNLYFKQTHLIRFDDALISLSKIMTINEEAVPGPQEMVRVRIVLVDGYQIIRKVTRESWISWKAAHA